MHTGDRPREVRQDPTSEEILHNSSNCDKATSVRINERNDKSISSEYYKIPQLSEATTGDTKSKEQVCPSKDDKSRSHSSSNSSPAIPMGECDAKSEVLQVTKSSHITNIQAQDELGVARCGTYRLPTPSHKAIQESDEADKAQLVSDISTVYERMSYIKTSISASIPHSTVRINTSCIS